MNSSVAAVLRDDPSPPPPANVADGLADTLILASRDLLGVLETRGRIEPHDLRAALSQAFGASDAAGVWTWKLAADAAEAALVLFLRRYGAALRARAAAPEARLALLERLADRLPVQSRRSEESQALQQFSTPLPLGFVASVAADLVPQDRVLEPSAGTGLLAVFAEQAGADLILNELSSTRAGLLARLFAPCAVSRHDAAAIHDRLAAEPIPSVVLMNPPFSAAPGVRGRLADAAWRHLDAALARLAPGGRLVAITGSDLTPDRSAGADGLRRLQRDHGAHLVFTAGVDGRLFARHGTRVATRLTVIDRVPAPDPDALCACAGPAETASALLALVRRHVPPRGAYPRPLSLTMRAPNNLGSPVGRIPRHPVASPAAPVDAAPVDAAPVTYEIVASAMDTAAAPSGLYEPYRLQTIRIPAAVPHPTPLVQSAAMAAVAPPRPRYRPLLPPRVVRDGVLSDAQIESLVYAGDAHEGHLSGHYRVDETLDTVTAIPADADGAVRFRRGWFLGDGTGAGKGRQVAGVLLDHWLRGRRRAVWISKSDALIEDAQRDWSALGGERLQVVPLSRFRQGVPVPLIEGILFTTYATLRSESRRGSGSRLRQILDWCGPAFDGLVVFDEAHAMAGAGGGPSERGAVAASLQGRAGLRLQHGLPEARVLYVSATGAVGPQNLAYAQRLGLWGTGDLPFPGRADFVAAMESGGTAALELMARDLKALGLYAARALSYAGVEVALLTHALTPEQVRIYDAYADAFQVIHRNLTAALEAANITGAGGATYNRHAKAAARSAFEANKQRFFGHLLTAMKGPSLIRSIERDLAAGHAAVVQIVSTAEALLERRLAEIPAGEWADLTVDVTPREYVLDYLRNAWPTQLFSLRSEEDGTLVSVPAADPNGQPVTCRAAVARRDQAIEHLAALPPVPAALDQIVQHFGTEAVAEVTGRGRRIVRHRGADGSDRHAVEARPAGANLSETQAFMDDRKRVLVFSDAGGTGRSYHADLGAANRRRRVHYLLEPGWRADAAIQGLGRTNRTNQAQPPLFRPVTTDVRGERRFISTIARRLDSLGAITRGQRQTGGQGLFRPEDNLESAHARAALRQLYHLLHAGRVAACPLAQFEAQTGLSLSDRDGSLREELPPIATFLNRILALRIGLQNALFAVFEALLAARVEAAAAAGHDDRGVETLTAESLRITARRMLYTHPGTGAATTLCTICERNPTAVLSLTEARRLANAHATHRLLLDARTGRAAVQIDAPPVMDDDGGLVARVRLVRPSRRETLAHAGLTASRWQPCADPDAFARAWEGEIADLPPFTERDLTIVTGLLLPVWDRLDSEAHGSHRVYRLRTDAGEALLGRLVPEGGLDRLYAAFGLAVGDDRATPSLAPDAVYAALRAGAALQLTGGYAVKRVTLAGGHRLELTGFSERALPGLKALGLTSEIVAWRLRLFVPLEPMRGPAVLAALLERHPLLRVTGARADQSA
jgi:hypothetical protein